MKRNNKKGFTIVELVIVIAVIAILSAVLIPTFGGVTKSAQEKADQANARNTYTQFMGDIDNVDKIVDYVKLEGETGTDDDKYYSVAGGFAPVDADTVQGSVLTGENVNYECNLGDECENEDCTIHATPAEGGNGQ